MAESSGRYLFIEIFDGFAFFRIAAVQSKSIQKNNEPIDITTDDSNGYRELLPEPGNRTVDISVSGITKDDALISAIRSGDLSFIIGRATINYPSGRTEEGDYYLNSLTFTGEYNGAVTFEATLQSTDETTESGVVVFDINTSAQVLLSNNNLTATSDYQALPFNPVLAASTEFELGAQGIESTFTIDSFNGLGDGFSIDVFDGSSFGLIITSDGFFQDDSTGNNSAVAVALSQGDIITIVVRETGNVYIGVNGVFYSWDGANGSTPVSNGNPTTDSNPTLTGFSGSTGTYSVSSAGLGDVTTWEVTAAVDV